MEGGGSGMAVKWAYYGRTMGVLWACYGREKNCDLMQTRMWDGDLGSQGFGAAVGKVMPKKDSLLHWVV